MKSLEAGTTRLALLILLAAGFAAFFLLGDYHTLTFEKIVAHRDILIGRADAHPFLTPTVFVTAYLILGLFGLPGSTILNLTAGLLFNFGKDLLLVVLSSGLASILAFFSFRYLFWDYVERRVLRLFPRLEENLQNEGFYLVFTLRLLPVIPYSLSNLVLAVSPVSFITYLWVTMIALLPRQFLYVYAGLHLGDLRDPDDLLSPALIGVLALLAILPWVLKWLMPKLKSRFIQETK